MKYRTLLALWVVCQVAGSAAAADDYSDKFYDLLKLMPDSINAIVVCDVEALYKSPLAVKERWETTNPLPAFPPRLRAAVLGAKFDPTGLHADFWEVGAAWLRERASLPGLAKQERGSPDTVGGLEAVLSPRNVYFIEFTPFQVGIMRPANRQEAAAWVRFAKGNPKVTLPPFLRDSVLGMDKKTQIMLALNLEDVASPALIRQRLSASKTVADKKGNVEDLARVLATLKGIKLGITVGDRVEGEMVADFGESTETLAPLAHPLLLEVLAKRGAAIDDLEDWKTQASGTRIAFRGPLSATGLREVMSLIQMPPLPAESEAASGASPELAREIQARASQRYFQTINTLLGDLKKPNRQLKTYGDMAVWYDKYAEKVEQLPVGNVDEELLKYGANVARNLRAVGASLRGELVHVTTLEGSKFAMVAVGGGWWSNPSINSNVGEVNVKQAEAIAKGADTRLQIWQLMNDETSSIRSRMRTKWKADF